MIAMLGKVLNGDNNGAGTMTIIPSLPSGSDQTLSD